MAPPEAAVAADHHAVPPPGDGRRRLQRQGRLPLSQQRPDAGRGARKGYDNALVADAMGNVAETRDGECLHGARWHGVHPDPQRHLPQRDHAPAPHREPARRGVEVVETMLTFEEFRQADEVFMTGNLNKVTPVVEFDGTHYQHGPITQKARDLYWDWAHSGAAE
jgi:branched-chain amino acid aminotransferase